MIETNDLKFIDEASDDPEGFTLGSLQAQGFDIIDTFCSINQTIDCFTQENYRLSGVRDTLLPKLISGELDVSEVQV